MHDAVAKLEDAILSALARGDAVHARAIQFLLRRYHSGARDDLGETVGRALAAALDSSAPAARDADVVECAATLELFVEAMTLTDDERLPDAVHGLVARLRLAWTSPEADQRAASLGACLHAAALPAFQSVAVDAVDELERFVARAYEPGEALGSANQQVRTAAALLTAYGLSGRLPYSMLAEELIQTTRRHTPEDFEASCEGARVLCRLAALHDDEEYRTAAILAPGADYRRDAARVLQPHEGEALRRGPAGAIYGIAVLELQSGTAIDNPPSTIRDPES